MKRTRAKDTKLWALLRDGSGPPGALLSSEISGLLNNQGMSSPTNERVIFPHCADVLLHIRNSCATYVFVLWSTLGDDPIHSARRLRKKIKVGKRIHVLSSDNVEFKVPLTHLSGMSSRYLEKVILELG